jgi:hypothetical protein
MGLLANYTVNNNLPLWLYGDGGPLRSSWNKTGAIRNPHQFVFDQPAANPAGYPFGEARVAAQFNGGMSTNLIGRGDAAAGGALGRNLSAGLTGSGDITTAALALVVSAVANITGSGGITGNLNAVLLASSALTGSGGVVGDITARGNAAAGLTGSGVATGTSTAPASLSAAIVVTGSGLTTSNVGAAVWAAIASATAVAIAASRAT